MHTDFLLVVWERIDTTDNTRHCIDRQDIAYMIFKLKHNQCPNTVKNLFLERVLLKVPITSDFYIPLFKTVTHGKHLNISDQRYGTTYPQSENSYLSS